MKAITLTQPWASLVAIGAKRIETRDWNTAYRGPLAIHAAKKYPMECQMATWEEPFSLALQRGLGIDVVSPGSLPKSAIIAIATIDTTFQFNDRTEALVRARSERGELPEFEADFGDYGAGRYGFVLRDVVRLATPIECRGALSIWNVPQGIVDQLALAAKVAA